MFTDRHSLFAAIAALGLIAATAAPARAQDAEHASRIVQTSDLDLHTQAGADALRHRVQVASRQVCGDNGVFGSPDDIGFYQCMQQARTQALKTSNALIASVRTGVRYALDTPR